MPNHPDKMKKDIRSDKSQKSTDNDRTRTVRIGQDAIKSVALDSPSEFRKKRTS